MKEGKVQLVWVLVFAVLLSTVAIWQGGCEKKTEPAAQQTTGQEEVILQKTCPVMEGNPINKDIFVEYQGKKVYFCCPACVEAFNKDPEKYISKLPQFSK